MSAKVPHVDDDALSWAEIGRNPDYSHLITEDNEPVDNIFSELQQRLLPDALYNGWETERPFLAFADVGLFHNIRKQAVVPDVMLSMDVVRPEGKTLDKHTRSYFIWEYGKPPDIVIEIVSNKKGNEMSRKVALYEQIGIPVYVVFDPMRFVSEQLVSVFRKNGEGYYRTDDWMFPDIGLGLTLWEGVYQFKYETWLRWCTLDGTLIKTGRERAETQEIIAEQAVQQADEARMEADEAKKQVDEAKKRADEANERAKRLAEQLRTLGIEPEV